MKDYRAATWAAVATIIGVLTAIGVIPASTAILGLTAGCSGLAVLHATMRPRTETIEIQLGAVNIAPAGRPVDPSSLMQELMRVYGGDDADRSPGDVGGGPCPVHGFACPNSD
jgi:hypothetical protein